MVSSWQVQVRLSMVLSHELAVRSFAGDNGIIITNLDTGARVRVPGIPAGRGNVTKIKFIRPKDSADDGLVYGTTSGYIGIWRKEGRGATLAFVEVDTRHMWTNTLSLQAPLNTVVPDTGEVVDFDYNDSTSMLCCLTLTGHLHTFRVLKGLVLGNLWSQILSQYTPMVVAFQMPVRAASEIWVLGLGDNM
jgi:hypothetical protein